MMIKAEPTFNIFLVEDNPADIRLIQEAVRPIPNINLTITDSSEAAIEQLKSYDLPGIIFLDLRLPKINGFGVLEFIKQQSNLKKNPVIILTVSDNEEDIKKAYDLGANAYIKKDLDYNRFKQMIKETIDYWKNAILLPSQVES